MSPNTYSIFTISITEWCTTQMSPVFVVSTSTTLLCLSMSFSSIISIYSHQLLSLLLILHHFLDGSWITDLLNFGVPTLPFCLLCFCFWPLLAGTLQQQRHLLSKHNWTMATLETKSCSITMTKAEQITKRADTVMRQLSTCSTTFKQNQTLSTNSYGASIA